MKTKGTMKAIRIHNYGGPEVLKYEEAPRPEPQADEVLIRVHAAGVNPIDWKVREGEIVRTPSVHRFLGAKPAAFLTAKTFFGSFTDWQALEERAKEYL